MEHTKLQPGDSIAEGRFRVIRLLGEGGFGEVYLAEQLSVGREVALKILHPALCRDPKVLARFEVEARNTCKLKHPNTVVFFDFGRDENLEVLWLSMEYLEGEELKDLLKREGPLPVDRVVHILQQVAASLHEAHEMGMIHRDLKPANVMLVERAKDHDFVKVIDFGIAKIVSGDADREAQLTKTGMLLGTPYYMAPEQVRGQHLDGRVDLYAMAIMAYEMLSGGRPFDGYSSLEIITQHLTAAAPSIFELKQDLDVPHATADYLLKALSKNPDDRPADILSFVEGLKRTLYSDSESTLDGVSSPSQASLKLGSAPLASHVKPTATNRPAYMTGEMSDITPAPALDAGKPKWLPFAAMGAGLVVLVLVLVLVLGGGDDKDEAQAASDGASDTQATAPAEADASGTAAQDDASPAAPANTKLTLTLLTRTREKLVHGSGIAAAMGYPGAETVEVAAADPEPKDPKKKEPEEKKTPKKKAKKFKCKVSLVPWGDKIVVDGKTVAETGGKGDFKARVGDTVEIAGYQGGKKVKTKKFEVEEKHKKGCRFVLKLN